MLGEKSDIRVRKQVLLFSVQSSPFVENVSKPSIFKSLLQSPIRRQKRHLDMNIFFCIVVVFLWTSPISAEEKYPSSITISVKESDIPGHLKALSLNCRKIA